MLNRHPWKTQMIQTGALMAAGDVIAELAIERKSIEELELLRVGRFACIGTFIMGPALRTWFTFLDKLVGNKGWSAPLKKVALDQGLYAPFIIGVFMLSNGALQGMSRVEIEAHFALKYLDCLRTGYKLWPFVQIVNFYLVPVQYRILLVQIIALGWNTFLAWKVNEPEKLPDIAITQVPQLQRKI